MVRVQRSRRRARRDGRPDRRQDDAGQATGLLVLVLVLALAAGALVARLGGVVHDRASARSVADAAALAAVIDGPPAAAELAAANGAELLEVRVDRDRVEVSVRVGDAEATSVARPAG